MPARPLGGLRNTILFAQHVVLELLEPYRMGLDVLLVIRALGHPHVRHAQIEGRVGVGQHRDPLVGMNGSAVVEVRRDVNLLDAEFGPPVAQPAGQLTVEAPRSGLGVASPEEDAVAVLGHIPHDVGHRDHLPQVLATPDVLGSPVPAFPAVGVARLQGVAAEQAQQAPVTAVGGVHRLGLRMPVGLRQDGLHAVLLIDTLDLSDHDVEGFIPGDALVLADAAILGVAPTRARRARGAVRVPVDPLERIEHPVRRVDPVLVAQGEGRDQGVHGGRELLPSRLQLPGLDLRVLLVVFKWAYADDLAFAALHPHAVGVRRDPYETEPAIDRLVHLPALWVFRYQLALLLD